MRTKTRLLTAAGTALLILAAGTAPARADDTDIYINGSSGQGSEPMVMFSLDYRPNLGSTACQGDECDALIADGYLPVQGSYTFFDVLRAVLKKVMEPLEGIKVGLMINHDNRNNCAGPTKAVANCSNGGYIARGFELFEADDGNGAKDEFNDILAAMPVPQGNLSHSYQGKELFFEFYRYLTGQGVYNGHVGFTDFSSNGATNLNVDNPGSDWDATIENVAGTTYISPIDAQALCAKIYTINIMFQVSNQEADSDTEIKKTIANGGMAVSGNNPTFPQVIQKLYDMDVADGAHGTAPALDGTQNVTSYFIVDPTKINTTTTGYAAAGGTGVPLALDEDPEELEETITDIFKQILSVSTTFVAASVPVNVFNRAEIVDNVYLGLFQVDADAQPYWTGNIKKLRIAGIDSGSPYLVDVNGDVAVAADGRIRYTALTYWTDASTLPAPDTDENEVAGKDGRSVARGGAGQKIPGFTGTGPGATNSTSGARQLFYDTAGGSLAALNADNGTATALQTDLGAADAATALALLNYARGMDVDDLDGDSNVTEARSWIFADPLHSRPLPINYGAKGSYTEDNPAIFIAAGSNDGYMRLIRNSTTGGAQSGQEVWGFMPRGVMDQLSTLRTNAAGTTHAYLTDGTPVVYMDDTDADGTIDTGEHVYLYFAMRRGEQAVYALDISNPDSPAFLWKIEKGGDFAELGYTFSDPRVINVEGDTGTIPGLIFGGGFDLDKDDGALGTDDSEGNAIYVVNAETGELIWKAVGGSGADSDTVFTHADLLDSIPSAVSILDSDGDGFHDRAYVGDSGGNIWRADMVGTDTGEWTLTRLAALGRHGAGASGKPDDRRFFARPDIVQSVDGDGAFDALLIGSGDREDPLDNGGPGENWLFMIKDRNVVKGTGEDQDLELADLGDVTSTCLTLETACTADLDNGWALNLTSDGEKGLATPVTVNNVSYFTTYVPPGSSSDGACGLSEGSGRLYAVSLFNAAAVHNYDTTTESDDRFSELKSGGIPAEVVALPPNSILRPDLEVEQTSAPTRFETYWFESEDGDL
jgi:type IV pilus assembly protein PilY1